MNITHPAELYGGTSMIDSNDDPLVDTFEASNYFNLADAPIMYSDADTTTMMVGGAEILVQVYSPNKVMGSKFVMDNVAEILNAQKDYLGGTLPIKKYAFLIYLLGGPSQIRRFWSVRAFLFIHVYSTRSQSFVIGSIGKRYRKRMNSFTSLPHSTYILKR